MIKLVEIFLRGDNSLDVLPDWKLREIVINPEFIIKMSPDENMKCLCKTNMPDALKGLHPDQEFTRIILGNNMFAIVVGSLGQIEEKIRNNKKLLKG